MQGNNPYRMYTPASFGQAPRQQQPQMPQLNLNPQLMPWPEQGGGGPSMGQALMGGVSQVYQAMQKKPGMGAAGGRFGNQVSSLLTSLQG